MDRCDRDGREEQGMDEREYVGPDKPLALTGPQLRDRTLVPYLHPGRLRTLLPRGG